MKQVTKQSIVVIIIIGLWISQVVAAINFAEESSAILTSFWDIFIVSVGYGLLFVVIVILLLKFQDGSLKQFILSKNRNLKKQLLFGLLLGIIMTFLALIVVSPIVKQLIPQQSNNELALSNYFSDLTYLPFWMILALFKGGFSEELWRTFGLVQFQRKFGNSGLYIALILGSFVFAMGHYYQGIDGVITSGIGGIIYGIVFIKRGSTFELIIAHGFRDVISILLGYMIFY